MTLTCHKVARLRDADAVWCVECDRLIAQRPDPYWDIDKSKGLHERGTTHKTFYVAFDWPAAADAQPADAQPAGDVRPTR